MGNINLGPMRSGPSIPPVFGMVVQYVAADGHEDPVNTVNHEWLVRYQTKDARREFWHEGRFRIISSPAPQPALVDAPKCKGAPCGTPAAAAADVLVSPEFLVECCYYNDGSSMRLYCSPACRDAAKAKAPGPKLKKLTTSQKNDLLNGAWLDAPMTFSDTRFGLPVPQPAPWKCIMVDCTTPSAPSATCKGASWCVVCEDKDAYRRTKERDEEAAEGRERRRQANRRAALPPYLGPLSSGLAQINRSPPQTIGSVVVSGGRVAGLDTTWEE